MVMGSLPHLLHGEVGLLVGCLVWVSRPVVEMLHRPLSVVLAEALECVCIPVRMNGWPFQDVGVPRSQLTTKWLADFLEE